MSQKVIWAVVIIVVVAGALWYMGVIPGMSSTPPADQSAAVAGAPSTTNSATSIQVAVSALAAAGKDEAKVRTASDSVRAAISVLAPLHTQLKMAVQASALKGNDMGKANAALTDYSARLSNLQGASITAANSASITANLNGIMADISTINTALASAKVK